MRGRGAGPLVWAAWAALAVGAVAFAAHFGRDCPFMDEWSYLDPPAGRGDRLAWLVEAHGEHRYPVPRAAWLGLYLLAGDLRAAMLANAAGTAAAAAGFLLALRRLRGRTAAADLFVPLALLHPGQWENWLMAYQLNFVGMAVLTAALAWAAVVPPERWGWGRVVAAGLAAVLLPGFGVYGLVFAAAAVAWLGWATWRAVPPGKRLVLGGLVALAVGLVLLVAVTQPAGGFTGIPRRPNRLLGFALGLVADTFGPGVAPVWPAAAGLALTAFAAAGVAVVRGVLAGDRVTLGLGLLLAAAGGVAAGLVWGRGWAGLEYGFTSRYALVMAGFAAVAMLVCVRAGDRLGPTLLAVGAAAAWPLNAVDGFGHALRVSQRMDALAADVRDGWPDRLLVERYHWQLWVGDATAAEPFPPVRGWVGFAPFPPTAPPVRAEPTAARPTPDGTRLVLPLPARPDLVGVRLVGRYRPARDTAVLAWANGDRLQVPANVSFPLVLRVTPGQREVEVWPGVSLDRYEVLAVDWLVR